MQDPEDAADPVTSEYLRLVRSDTSKEVLLLLYSALYSTLYSTLYSLLSTLLSTLYSTVLSTLEPVLSTLYSALTTLVHQNLAPSDAIVYAPYPRRSISASPGLTGRLFST
jgi:hypothetical protein